MTETYDAREVANFILDRCDSLGREISNLSLQKIVFFCHVWALTAQGKPLIREQFEAWRHGPVLPYLYREFKDNEDKPIKRRASKLNKLNGQRELATYNFDNSLIKILEETVDSYSKLDPFQLVQLSHVASGPWEQVWNHNKKINAGMRISDESILTFYSPKIRAN